MSHHPKNTAEWQSQLDYLQRHKDVFNPMYIGAVEEILRLRQELEEWQEELATHFDASRSRPGYYSRTQQHIDHLTTILHPRKETPQ